MGEGSFGYPGVPRSYSFPRFHADIIPTTAATNVAEQCPSMECEQVALRNSWNSSGNIVIGVQDRLNANVNRGITLQPGEWTPWIPVENLNRIWHIDAASSYLEYMLFW